MLYFLDVRNDAWPATTGPIRLVQTAGLTHMTPGGEWRVLLGDAVLLIATNKATAEDARSSLVAVAATAGDSGIISIVVSGSCGSVCLNREHKSDFKVHP